MSLETQLDALLDPMTQPGRVGQMCRIVPDLCDQIWRCNNKEARLGIPILFGRDTGQWVFEPGEFDVWVAPHAGAGLAGHFTFGENET